MNPVDFTIILVLVVAWLYWLNAAKAKEIARWVGKEACKEIGVSFLDDTVALNRVWIGKNDNGERKLFRRYRFEFTSDGSQRYKGEIVISEAKLVGVELEPYRIPPQENRLH